MNIKKIILLAAVMIESLLFNGVIYANLSPHCSYTVNECVNACIAQHKGKSQYIQRIQCNQQCCHGGGCPCGLW